MKIKNSNLRNFASKYDEKCIINAIVLDDVYIGDEHMGWEILSLCKIYNQVFHNRIVISKTNWIEII